ncbi:hypothetical protein GNI_130780 [Gregarina niphandrodes]|uniref:Uncharacterized protein n=1 Tax=Gregarina niphandrodes TaxID=110365 RepID=A0A023B1T4_GRENI|nr:hypothetical protein GNI_130780 [Gregarina niphandrodes]EZG47652.1 hypothetical protein GNI_130780 [Gregarina niphandrodes]|eukprot:XP_011132154.1 hypothetical protein GNI_130780 [Gregarina niphandrodes]
MPTLAATGSADPPPQLPSAFEEHRSGNRLGHPVNGHLGSGSFGGGSFGGGALNSGPLNSGRLGVAGNSDHFGGGSGGEHYSEHLGADHLGADHLGVVGAGSGGSVAGHGPRMQRSTELSVRDVLPSRTVPELGGHTRPPLRKFAGEEFIRLQQPKVISPDWGSCAAYAKAHRCKLADGAISDHPDDSGLVVGVVVTDDQLLGQLVDQEFKACDPTVNILKSLSSSYCE